MNSKQSSRAIATIPLTVIVILLGACGGTPTVVATIEPSPTLISPTETSTPIPPTFVPTWTSVPATVTPDDELRLTFFRNGGVWSFFINRATDSGWPVLVLGSKSALVRTTKITLGSAELSQETTIESASKVLDLYSADVETKLNFFHLYADGIERGEFEALLIMVKDVQEGEIISILAAVTLSKQSFLELILSSADS